MTFETKLNSDDGVRAKACPACGSVAGSQLAKACTVCGKLIGEGFQPLDAIRSSHGLQGKRLDIPATEHDSNVLFADSGALSSNPAWACTVYAMVPYLGVLFIPPALLMSGYLLVKADRRSDVSDAILCITVGSILLVAQLVLWWLLYLIPEIGI